VFVGRPVPGPGEEAWTETDVAYALEWKAIEADRCSGCGQPASESFNPANLDAYGTKDLVCFACQARDLRIEEIPGDDRHGRRVIPIKDR
jgi:hypothetical protein